MNAQAIIAAAKAIVPILPFGGPAIAAGKAIVQLIDDTKGTVEADARDVDELAKHRDELERAVNAHADRTAASLG